MTTNISLQNIAINAIWTESDITYPDNLRAEFLFEYGNTGLDTGPNLYDATVFGTTTVDTTNSKQGKQSMYFDASRYLIAPNVVLPSSYPFSISCWVYPTNLTVDNQALCGMRNGNTDGITILMTTQTGITAYNRREIGVYILGNTNAWIYYNFVLSAYIWTHLVFVSTSSATNLYANGVLIPHTFSGAYTYPTSFSRGSVNFGIGNAMNTGFAVPFIGYIDSFKIYDKALSTDEILTLYKYPKETHKSTSTTNSHDYLGIGTTDPSHTLDVNGDIFAKSLELSRKATIDGVNIPVITYQYFTVTEYNGSRQINIDSKGTHAVITVVNNQQHTQDVWIKDGNTYSKRSGTWMDFAENYKHYVRIWYHWKPIGTNVTAICHWWN